MRLLARWRVTLGFIAGGVVLWLATPTPASIAVGGALASAGEVIRLWAAGHLEKSREVTRSGPYRYLRHPLYVGSSLIGLGVAIASAHLALATMVLLYLATTIPAAVLSEEAHLREKFGSQYEAYAQRQAPPMVRPFSLERARRNREHRTIVGVLAGFALLALKLQLSLR